MDGSMLEARKQAALELGLTVSDPVFYEVEAPDYPRPRYGRAGGMLLWTFTIYGCSLGGGRDVVWSQRFAWRRYGAWRAKRWAARFAREAEAPVQRFWVGGGV